MDPEREEASIIEAGSGLAEEHKAADSIDKCLDDFGLDRKDSDNSASVKVTVGNVGHAEICCDGNISELKTPVGEEPCSGVLDVKNCPKLESLDCSIEEGLEKVSLGGGTASSNVIADDTKETKVANVSNGDDNDSSSESESESESESGTSSSSPSSSSSSSARSSSSESNSGSHEEEEKKEKVQLGKIMTDNTELRAEVEEGEIMGSDVEKMVSWSDNGDENDDNDESGEDFVVGDVDGEEGITLGPIKSKNELVALPPVPPVNVTLQPCHQILPVGVISSILGPHVIVEGSEKHNPLSEGSILWITEKKLPLGLVDEIFGPVKTPYYIVRYNSESEVPAGIETGTLVGFVPEFVDHVLNDKNLYQKGYDASGENDEEVPEEFEFSDDEKEAEFKRMMKMSKRGNNDNNNQGPGNKRNNRRNPKNRDNRWKKDQFPASQSQTRQTSLSYQKQQPVNAPPPLSLSQGNQVGLPSNAPILPAGTSGPTSFLHQAQAQVSAGFLFNGLWPNGMPIQQQNMGFPAEFQINGMPWIQPQHPPNPMQMSSMTSVPWQQQQPFDLSQLVTGSLASPATPMNFATRPAHSPWPGMSGSNLSSNQASLIFPGLGAQFSMFQGMQQPHGPQAGQNSNFQPTSSFPGNVGAHAQFNQGSPINRGRGRKPVHQRGRDGCFGGARGRQQFK